MWTNENRGRYDRSKLRYPSDLTDEEWAFIAPVIPPAKRGGGKRTVSVRDVVNGLMNVLSTGCQWQRLFVYSGAEDPTSAMSPGWSPLCPSAKDRHRSRRSGRSEFMMRQQAEFG